MPYAFKACRGISYFIFIFVLFAGFVRIRIDYVLLNNEQREVLCNETEE